MNVAPPAVAVPPSRRLTMHLRAVGGQMLHFTARQLLTRLSPIVESAHVEETHGMAQRGGSVSAVIDVQLLDPYCSRVGAVLLGLERIEGARGLGVLRPGDAAFIGSAAMLPPGTTHRADVRAPTDEELTRVAAELGIELVLVDTPLSSPWNVIQAAIDAGAIPKKL
jgi:phage tail protein X